MAHPANRGERSAKGGAPSNGVTVSAGAPSVRTTVDLSDSRMNRAALTHYAEQSRRGKSGRMARMTWRSAHDCRDMNIPEKVFDQIPYGSSIVRLVASPMHYVDSFGTWQKGPFGLAITGSALILAKAKAFGGVKVELEIPIGQFRRGSVGLRSGSTFYETYSELGTGGGISFLFYKVDSAEAVYEYINSGVAMDQSRLSNQ
jgi:hypothetical protein